jgi:ABC-type bacteriocin/lantibiotic exporter with double-glycine peptidase domain
MAKNAGIKVVVQKRSYDCGLAAMAMLAGVPYGDVSAVARLLYEPKRLKNGLAVYQLEAIGERLDVPLKRIYKSKGYLTGKTGILGINWGKSGDARGHWVVLKDGDTVIDPEDGSVHKLFDYVDGNGRTATLLVAA